MPGIFQILYQLFRDRFFETADAAHDVNEDRFYQTLGLLSIPGLMVSMFLVPQFMDLSFRPPGPRVDWILRTDRLFFPLYSFAVVGFATFFEWDRLFPSRPDFLILTPFPISIRNLFFAKLASLARFLGALLIAANAFSVLLLPVFMAYMKQARAAGVLRLAFSQIAATSVAALFAFFVIAAIQGLLLNLFTPRALRRISPWFQIAGMSAMVLCLFLYPLWAAAMKPLAESVPIYWFTGIYDLTLPNPNPQFVALGLRILRYVAFAFAAFVFSWTSGFARQWRQTLESGDEVPTSQPRSRLAPIIARCFHNQTEHGIFRYSLAALARSQKHRLFLATYLSVGLAFGILFALGVRNNALTVSMDGLRSFPFLIAFFVVSGFRTAFQFPAELGSNWLFQIAGSSLREPARRATRKLVIATGLLPVVILCLPVEIFTWGIPTALFHVAFQLAAGLLLVEALFWNFDKIPFTCSWFPGATNLAVLVGFYLYGFTSYSFQLADLEASLDRRPAPALTMLTAASLALAFLWKRHGKSGEAVYDGSVPELQTLNL